MGNEKEKLFPAVNWAAGRMYYYTRIFIIAFGLISLLLIPVRGHCAPVDDAIRQQQQIQQQQEQRRLDLERQHREEMEKLPSGEDLRLPEVPEAAPDAPCFEAKSIELSGVTLLNQTEIENLIFPYKDRCLTLSDVNNLVRDITNTYIDKGYVTTRAAIPQQDFSSGHLVIMVIEGKVESIEFKENNGHAHELKTAFPGITGY